MGRMERNKGKAWERAVAALLRPIYPGVRRNLREQARDGGEGSDLVGLPFRAECKHRKRCNVQAALEQAAAVAGQEPPLAICRDTGRRPIAAMYLDDFLALLARAAAAGQPQPRPEDEGAHDGGMGDP